MDPSASPAVHATLLHTSHLRLVGVPLVDWDGRDPDHLVNLLRTAPFALLSHGTEPDPLFNEANLRALELFEMSREQMIGMPSRLSAEAPEREERDRLLEQVTRHGFITDYTGIRISASGRRFCIRNATVWNLIDEQGLVQGQAARFQHWQYL